MNFLKQFLLIVLALFLKIECGSATQPKQLKAKLKKSRTQVGQIFATDNQPQLEQKIENINVQTPQDQQVTNIALQEEVAKETAEIKTNLTEASQEKPQYISSVDAIEIAISKKELSKISQSSWTDLLIIKPFNQTYRLFLRVWNPKEYTSLLEKERKTVEHALNVQAYNNLEILRISILVAVTNSIEEQNLDVRHMFEKDNFYNIMTNNVFEGGAILAAAIEPSTELVNKFGHISELITGSFYLIKKDPAVVQSIWSMNQVIKEAYDLKEQNLKAHNKQQTNSKAVNPLLLYSIRNIEQLCINAAQVNGWVLRDNKKSYSQYLKDWISNPKNVAKAGLVMAAIGGLYLYGPAIPSWLKDYTNNSISSMKEKLSKGYQTTLSSMKNLWNNVRGNSPSELPAVQELPDPRESRMDSQEQDSSIDQYFVQEGKKAADRAEQTQEIATTQAEDFLQNEFNQQYTEQQYKQGWDQFGTDAQLERNARIMQEKAVEAQTNDLQEQQQVGQQLNDFDQEIEADELARDLQQRNWDADQAKAREAESLEKARAAREQMITNLEQTREEKIKTTKKLDKANEEIELNNESIKSFTKRFIEYDETKPHLYEKKFWENGIEELKEIRSNWEERKKAYQETLTSLNNTELGYEQALQDQQQPQAEVTVNPESKNTSKASTNPTNGQIANQRKSKPEEIMSSEEFNSLSEENRRLRQQLRGQIEE